MSSSKRHFTTVVGSKENGIYISSSPSSAARKIVSKLCASSKSKKVEFCVRETTQKSEKKTYGPYLGEMKKLAKPIELKGRIIRYAPIVHLKKKKTATKTVIKLGKKNKRGGGPTKNVGIKVTEYEARDLDITDFELPPNLTNYFIIKLFGTIPYLFLYSNEPPNTLKNKQYRSEYYTHYKFSISDHSEIFQYKKGEIIDITGYNFNSLYGTGLFELLLQESRFHNNTKKPIATKTIINIIREYYEEYRGIIDCLEKLHSMYEKSKRNVRLEL